LIELAIGWVGHKTEKALDPKYKLPKMKYKGDEVRILLFTVMIRNADHES
jgi:hypothetical protein